MVRLHTTPAKRTIAYLRWLRMNTHWWRYFNASSKNLWKYERMRGLLLSDTRWYRSFPAHFHYDVSLDEFYKFLEQVLDEFQIPHAVLEDFRVFSRERRQAKLIRPRLNYQLFKSSHRIKDSLVLRI